MRPCSAQDYADTPGNLGVYALQRQSGFHVEFLPLTLWESVAAVKREEYEKARYYPEDKDFLIEMEPFVTHYDVMHAAVK